MFCADCFLGREGGGGRVCTRWDDLHVIAEKMKMYYCLHVAKIPYPRDDS
jgi:hypothetical protein